MRSVILDEGAKWGLDGLSGGELSFCAMSLICLSPNFTATLVEHNLQSHTQETGGPYISRRVKQKERSRRDGWVTNRVRAEF